MKTRRKTSLNRFLYEVVELSRVIDRLAQLEREGRLVDREAELDEVYICTMYATRALSELQLFMDETMERMREDECNRNLKKLFWACSVICDALREIELADSCEQVIEAARRLKEDLPCLMRRAKRYVKAHRHH